MNRNRIRFFSEHTLLKPCDLQHLCTCPPPPVINNLVFEDEDELDDLFIPPSNEYEKNKSDIDSFFTDKTVTDCCNVHCLKELNFDCHCVSIKSNRLRRSKSRSTSKSKVCCHRSPKIFDLLNKKKD